MKKVTIAIACLILGLFTGMAQQKTPLKPIYQKFLAEQDVLNQKVTAYIAKNQKVFYSLPENEFVAKVDSYRSQLESQLKRFTTENQSVDKDFVWAQQVDIHYSFDALVLGYPYWHEIFTGKKVVFSSLVQQQLDKNLPDFNNQRLLASPNFRAYIKGFLHIKSDEELEKPEYKGMDNRKLTAIFRLIPLYFTDQVCRDFWAFDYLKQHIENTGIKNLDALVKEFNTSCKDSSLTEKINSMVEGELKQRKGDPVQVYKTVGGYELDLHLFLPPDATKSEKRPVFVFFHGGSWTEGKPDFGFNVCKVYAQSGWVGVAVEYRVYDRHGSTPFDSVMDARSAIRWLRKNADQYNIDANRIVAVGNSTGGHLVLCTAMADKWNEKTDDLKFNPVPNLLMVNSAIYDLTGDSWITKDLKDKSIVKEISPDYLVKKGMPPTLVIHGEKDMTAPIHTATVFEANMKTIGNNFEFHSLPGAGHFFWYNEAFSKQVLQIRQDFLKKHGYE